MADSKFGVCYIWFISSLLFIFTVSGAVFLVLFMMQPGSPTTSSYPIIGVSLVCFPWFFWLLTILYRLISRACGFRMSCFGSNGVDHSNNNNNYNIYNNNIPSGGRTGNNNGGHGGSPINNASLASINVNEGGGNLVNENGNMNEHGNGNGNENENRTTLVGTPRRVHFGGVVVLGEDDGGANKNQGRSESLPSPSSSSSSDNGDEIEMPLKFSMA